MFFLSKKGIIMMFGILVAVRFGERKDRRYRKDDIVRFIKKIN